ncbi:MAG: ATP-binding protein [Oscillospiraceae bacterium]|nr:ATP-binding protein [Oscillospiraceae bacterium]
MSFNEQYFDKALAKLEERRAFNRMKEQARSAEINARLPEYAKLDELLATTSAKLIMIMLQEKDKAAEKLSQLETGNLHIQRNMEELLVNAGYPADYLDPIYTCPKCKDKGTLNGKWCECFQRIMLNIAAEELNSFSPLEPSTFDKFSLEYYSAEKDEKLGTSPRVIMQKNLEFCKSYAKEFSTHSNGILMTGGTGLGKTHLSLAIVNQIMANGFNAIYGSAPEMLRVIEREYYSKEKNEKDTMDALTQCDLLVLDDLGAEMDKQLYTSLLYELLNARLCRGLPTIVSSNLTPNELKQRYQDRICSRLFGFELLMFVGSDVRRKLTR